MGAKKNKSKHAPTFSVRFVGKGISPETVSLRTVSDAISAIQRLAIGDLMEVEDAPNDTIHLVGVKRGSAVFGCFTNITTATSELERIQGVIESGKNDEIDYALTPVSKLSDIAKRLGCRIQVLLPDKTKIVEFDLETFDRVSDGLISHGESTIYGKLTRVGGSTRNHCELRIPGRVRLLHCKVQNDDLARKLGRWLYQDVALTGMATWVGRSFHISKFIVKAAYQPKVAPVDEMLETLRDAGGSGWDKIDDVNELLSRD